ncbi:MAG: lysophospholipid acyltransferase family protein [Pseudomonadota bacterium]
MTTLRSALFNLLFFSGTLVLALLSLPTLLLPKEYLFVSYRLWARMTASLLKHICGITWRVTGDIPPEGGGYITAGKHQSAWETILLSLVLDRPAFVLKKELNWLPLIGWYIWKLDMIPIDRSAGSAALRAMLGAARQAAKDGRPIVIFPEGTRVAPGTSKPYQPGVAALYRQLDMPIHPFALNSGQVWPRQSWRKYPGAIEVRFLPQIPPGLKKAELLETLKSTIEPASDALLSTQQNNPVEKA